MSRYSAGGCLKAVAPWRDDPLQEVLMSDVQKMPCELLKTGLLVSFRVLDEDVLSAPADDAEFGMRVRLKFTTDPGDEDLDEDEVAEDTVEWGSFGFMFAVAALSFADARPRGLSEGEYRERDELKVSDFLDGLRFVRGALRFDADYIRGRRIKTRITVRPDGIVTLETAGRGKSALRWLERLQGTKLMQVVASD